MTKVTNDFEVERVGKNKKRVLISVEVSDARDSNIVVKEHGWAAEVSWIGPLTPDEARNLSHALIDALAFIDVWEERLDESET